MLYEAIFRGLHAARIRYLIVGAVAINLHGVPRMTADLDLMVDMKQNNLRSFVETVTGLGYCPRVPVQAEAIFDATTRREGRQTKSMVMFTWIHSARPYEEVDLFLENPIDFETAYVHRKDLPVGDFTIPLANIPDLITLKQISGREQDRSDIEALRQIQRQSGGGQA